MDSTTAIVLAGLFILWLALLFLTFRAPDAPKPMRLLFFQALLLVTIILGYFFMIKIVKWNPNPLKIRVANILTGDRMIYLGDIVPGVYDLKYIERVDTDLEEETIADEWVVFYQYDVFTSQSGDPVGPYGGAIYDYDRCRPPTIFAFELVPVNYDYLGETSVEIDVDNIIKYKDPLSQDRMANDLDRPEVIITGKTRGVQTDLNIFRKVGTDIDCVPRRNVQIPPQLTLTPVVQPEPQDVFQVAMSPYGYQNIGSFRGSHSVSLNGSRVVVNDRAGFERSQLVVRKIYTPKSGTYFQKDRPNLLVPPDEVSIQFGPGRPDNTLQVYYPEKTVLAFFTQLGTDTDAALGNTCAASGKGKPQYHPEDFGLALPVSRLQQTVVCEIIYEPDVLAEQNHEDRTVWVKVVEVEKGGSNDCSLARPLACTVRAQPNPSALPYGCEWCLLNCVAQ